MFDNKQDAKICDDTPLMDMAESAWTFSSPMIPS